jgi:hypothetical protein
MATVCTDNPPTFIYFPVICFFFSVTVEVVSEKLSQNICYSFILIVHN